MHDKEAIYDEQIAPLMTKIIAVCQEHDIPMVVDFQLTDEAENPLHCTTRLPATWGSDIHANILRLLRHGWRAVPPITAMTKTSMPKKDPIQA
jgi:hypothetical protein